GLGELMKKSFSVNPAAVFAFGLVAFGFLGMGPVTIAVDSYGPVTDTAKPVLIGTAVVGATTMIFSIIVVLTGLEAGKMASLSLMHAPFLLGLITGGAVIYWFTGTSIQAVSTGAYRAVEFIKANIKLEGTEKASIQDSKKVVEICTRYAQAGMRNIFMVVFFSTLAFACFNPYFFIGYLISIALFGLFQALFMANAGGAWDNAK